jgi:hypothetical protein
MGADEVRIQPVKALYYPRVHFDSMGWLKSALLYWEGLVRIVPEGLAQADPPEVHALAAAGLIESVSPARYERAATSAFMQRLEKALALQADFSACLGGVRRPRDNGKYHLIGVGEIDPGLLRDLEAYGLAAAEGDWVTMSAEMAKLYMLTLADEIAIQLNAAPATDEPLCDVATSYFARRALSDKPNPMMLIDGYAYARSIAPFPSLESASLPIDRLLKVRQKYAEERRAFRALVQERAGETAALESVEAIDSHLRDLTSELENEAAIHRRARRASRARETWKFVGIGTPASLGAIVTFAGAPPLVAALGGIGSIGAAMTEWLLGRRQARRPAMRYLVSLDALLNGARADLAGRG